MLIYLLQASSSAGVEWLLERLLPPLPDQADAPFGTAARSDFRGSRLNLNAFFLSRGPRNMLEKASRVVRRDRGGRGEGGAGWSLVPEQRYSIWRLCLVSESSGTYFFEIRLKINS